MKWLVRFFVCVVTFVAGVVASSMMSPRGLQDCVVNFPKNEDLYLEERFPAITPNEIRVVYAGLKLDATEPMLRMLILNGSDHEINYSAKISNLPYPILTANGKELPQVIGCGTGIKSYFVAPGTYTEVHVSPRQFLERPRKSADITVGFYLRSANHSVHDRYTSEKFRLPEEFRNAMNPLRY